MRHQSCKLLICLLTILSIPLRAHVPFVRVHLMGQLGNQMFEIATAAALAWDHDVELNVPELLHQSETYQRFFSRWPITTDERPISFDWREPKELEYSPIPYMPNLRLIGFFQSEKYFSKYREKILDLYEPSPGDLFYMITKYPWLFESQATVGIQLRDYNVELGYRHSYPQYGKDYLKKAMQHFPPTHTFVVSSNNIPFAKQSIPEGYDNVVFLEGEQDYLDMYLLSYCHHTIISNSSFGWWAAYMNRKQDQVVIRPKNWFDGYSAEGLTLDNWIVIDADDERSKEPKEQR